MGMLWSKPAPEPVGFDATRYGHTRDDSAGLALEREPSPAADGQMQWQPDQQAVWVPDYAHRECMLCKMTFGWFARRHHCRQCGSLVCQECSPHRALARGYMVPQRVCSGCMGALIMAEQSAAASRRQSAERDSRARKASTSTKRSANASAATSRQSSRRASREERQPLQQQQQQPQQEQPQQPPHSIAAPVPVRGAASASVLVLHGESSSSVKATASSASTASITTSVVSAGLPPPHTARSSRPASPSASLAAGQQPFSTHHSTLSLSVGGAVTSTASTIVDSPSAAAGATSIRRPSITAVSREHSPSHSPRRRKSISGSPAFQMPLPAASTAAAAVPASFVVESLPPLVLFNRLAGFGSLLVLDVRSAEQYREGHVPRALNLPLSDGDLLSAEDVQRALEPAECTAMLSALEQRLHMTDQRAFRMRQRCTIVIVGQPADEASLSAVDAAAAATSAAAAAAAGPCSLTPLMSASHSPLCLHLSRLLLLEGKVAAVSVLSGGFPAFQSGYPFVVCGYTPPERRAGKHIHKKPFPWYPNEVLPGGIFLGSKVDASNLEHLKQIRVGAVLNCTAEIPNHFEEEDIGEEEEEGELRDGEAAAAVAEEDGATSNGQTRRRRFIYQRIELADEVTVSISSHFASAFAFLDGALGRGSRVLVHCQEGISRSSTIVIAYLMSRQGLSLQQAYGWVKAQRKQIFPNLGFWRQLDLFERTIMRQRMVEAAVARGEEAAAAESAVPALEDIKGSLDQCIDVALLTAEYEARKAAAEGRKAEGEGEEASSSSSSSSSLSDADLTPSQRVQRAVLMPAGARGGVGVGRGGTLSRVQGVASDDAKTRAEEAVVEEAQTPCGPIVTSE